MKTLLKVLLFFIPVLGSAQICSERIEMANKLLEVKEYAKSIELVRECASVNQNSYYRWQAYRVMSIAYLYIEKRDSAKWASIELLKLNPGYWADPITNPKGFTKLTKEYNEVKPYTFYSNYFIGSTHTQVNVSKTYAVNVSSKTYYPLLGMQMGAQVGMYINPNFSVDFGVSTLINRYSIRYDIPNWKLHYFENLLAVQAPLSFQYIINPQSRLRYGVRTGFFKQYLLTSENSFESTYLPTNSEINLNRELSSERRNRWGNGYFIGFTALYKTGKGHLNFSSSFVKSRTQFNKPDTRYDEMHLLKNYYYLDDDISMDNFAFSIGYTHLFHKTVKKFD